MSFNIIFKSLAVSLKSFCGPMIFKLVSWGEKFGTLDLLQEHVC